MCRRLLSFIPGWRRLLSYLPRVTTVVVRYVNGFLFLILWTWDTITFQFPRKLNPTSQITNTKRMTLFDIFANKLFKLMMTCKFELLRFNLRLINHYLFGTRRHITPSISPTLMNKIRVTLSMIEEDDILVVDYWNLLLFFDSYCQMFFPNEYHRVLNGPIFNRQ